MINKTISLNTIKMLYSYLIMNLLNNISFQMIEIQNSQSIFFVEKLFFNETIFMIEQIFVVFDRRRI